MPIGIGDTIPAGKDKNGDEIAISQSIIGEGDTGIILQDETGDDIVIVNGAVGVGDIAPIGVDKNGDLVIIQPGGCLPIDVSLIRTWLSTHRSYSYRLDEDFTINNRFDYPKLNLKVDWMMKCNGGSMENPTIPDMYPCGAVWLGLGSPDSYGDPGFGTWLWRLWPSPYYTLGFGFDMDLRTGESSGGVTGQMGKLVQIDLGEWIQNSWCVPNFLYYYTGGGWNPYAGFTVRYLHFHIRNTISLYFGGDGGAVSEIGGVNVCLGEADPGWCGGAFEEEG